jgi:hypothetical protein
VRRRGRSTQFRYSVLMIRLSLNDLIAISSGTSLYYAIVLGRPVLFGGTLCYVFHQRSRRPREASYFLAERRPGFHAIVDWIAENRQSRVTRAAKNVDASLYAAPGLFKQSNGDLRIEGSRKPPLWWIVDATGEEKKKTRRLTEGEKRLPNFSCFSGDYALKLARNKWVVEADHPV